MVFRSFWVGALLLLAWPLAACDACGCSMSPSYAALMPSMGGHYVGFWWQHQQYRTFTDPAFETGLLPQDEYFNTLEIRTRWEIHPRLQATLMLPYAYHLRQDVSGPRTVRGLGDVGGLLSYTLYDNSDSLQRKVRHRIVAGIGGKAPTGAFQKPTANEVVNPNFQVGTGSWDALFNLNYTARSGRTGLLLDATYRLNGAGQNGYQFGNRFAGLLSLFRVEQIGGISVMPNLGLYYEEAGWDIENGYYRTYTGGHAWLANAGAEVFWQRYNLGVTYSLPLQQNWNTGLVESRSRVALHLNYFF